ncbi:hypothetical protein scyTo_0011952 [Scyliorhinus torazame]|uniref:DDE-1 domain-containing protein n=1 Tax=Scyliorhinus torazame TaxID=75743 RepID=A0A401NZ06_SCYTO|nr:hypothetical protein [Scyliorhinus torazame]
MDETSLNFEIPANMIISKIAEEKSKDCAKIQFTVVPSCLANGITFVMMVIIKTKALPKEEFQKDIVIHVYEKSWMDEGGYKKWSRKCGI